MFCRPRCPPFVGLFQFSIKNSHFGGFAYVSRETFQTACYTYPVKKKGIFILIAGLILVVSCVDLDKITINSPDLSQIADGTYQGKSRVGPVRVTLDVTVKNRAMSSIKIIKHFNGRGKRAEAIVPEVIEAQSLNVDVVSGATGNSKAILKAIENALTINQSIRSSL